MAKKPFRPQHLELRHKTYFALLTIPKDVQHIIGKKRFFKTTGTGDARIAQAKAELFIIKWKAEIANARQKNDDPIVNSAIELNKMLKSTPSHMVQDVIEEETDRLRDEVGDLIADTFAMIATGKSKTLDSYIGEWEKHQLSRIEVKTVSQIKSDLKLLTDYIPATNLLESKNCDAWINAIAESNNYKSASVTRIIGSCNNFYRYLQDMGVFSESMPSPFKVPKKYKRSKKPNAKEINKRGSWIPFKKSELEQLHSAAVAKNDTDLIDLICIAAYTGARIEEICSLKKNCVDLTDKFVTIEDAKTEAGNREVPIHSSILKIIKRLIQNSTNDFVFCNLTPNKFQDRSNAIGKRFGRLKSELGYGKHHVFHSIRKTFTTELERAGVGENVAADIVGHEKQTMTYGLYSGGSSMEQKRIAIEKVNFSF